MRYTMKLKLTHDEVRVLVYALNELVAYAESVAEAIIGKPKKTFDECIFLHTLRIASACMATNSFRRQWSFSQIS